MGPGTLGSMLGLGTLARVAGELRRDVAAGWISMPVSVREA